MEHAHEPERWSPTRLDYDYAAAQNISLVISDPFAGFP